MDLWTIGTEKAAVAPFVATLAQAGVCRVLDVHDLPLSRRPGFSKNFLRAGLAAAGIDYVHLRPLGTPPEGRQANGRRQWPRFWQIVDDRLKTPEARHAPAMAATLAAEAPACLLCCEADPCICHRLRVGEWLSLHHGFTVRHLAVPMAVSSPTL